MTSAQSIKDFLHLQNMRSETKVEQGSGVPYAAEGNYGSVGGG